jgi:hypothetical protein
MTYSPVNVLMYQIEVPVPMASIEITQTLDWTDDRLHSGQLFHTCTRNKALHCIASLTDQHKAALHVHDEVACTFC